jgi:hypothetical protein
LQKGKVLNLFLALPLRLLPPLLGVGRCIRQALIVILGCISSLAHLRKLILEEGNSLSEALCLIANRG